jgi:flagella basal body P-ring formation protein FlgA
MNLASPLSTLRRSSRLVAGFCSFLLFAGLCSVPTPGLYAAEPTPPSAAVVPPAEAPALRVFNQSDLLALLTATLQRDYVKDRGELELTFQQPWPALSFSNEPITLKVMEAPASGVAPSFIVRFQLCTAGETLGTWQAAVQAHVWRTVWVAHSNLRRGLPVHGADIVSERFDVLNVREALADFSVADEADLELAESVGSGVPLLARMIKLQAVIHRGQVANALIQDGMLSITAKVEALEDGAPGQVIHVRNPISRHDLSGRVLDNQTILVSL